MRDRQRTWRTKTLGHCYIDPYLLFSRFMPHSELHLGLLLLFDETYSTEGQCVPLPHRVHAGHSPWLTVFDPSLTVSNVGICIYDFTTPTHFQSVIPVIWLHLRMLLLFIYTSVSCAEISLIDGSVMGQYATRSLSKEFPSCTFINLIYFSK